MRLANLPSSDEWEGEINKVSVFDTECKHRWHLIPRQRVVECGNCSLGFDIKPENYDDAKKKVTIDLGNVTYVIFLQQSL
jgi:hypothetical protein